MWICWGKDWDFELFVHGIWLKIFISEFEILNLKFSEKERICHVQSSNTKLEFLLFQIFEHDLILEVHFSCGKIKSIVILCLTFFAWYLKNTISSNSIFEKFIIDFYHFSCWQVSGHQVNSVIKVGITWDCCSNWIEEWSVVDIKVSCHQNLNSFHFLSYLARSKYSSQCAE